MTIDEAIAHEKEVAKEIYVEAMLCHANPDDGKLDSCIESGRYHERLAEWLEELKMLRELKDEHRKIGNIEGFNKGYSKAKNDYYAQSEKDIDDLIAKCENAKFAESDEIALSDIHTGVNSGLSMAIHLAEQLKAGA
ncbi:MAG: hypothetical protein SO170_07515 [Butyribacter sp.]|nr:hypothetical protein [Butyribacter sp.]